jgi:hypothetical protein
MRRATEPVDARNSKKVKTRLSEMVRMDSPRRVQSAETEFN